MLATSEGKELYSQHVSEMRLVQWHTKANRFGSVSRLAPTFPQSSSTPSSSTRLKVRSWRAGTTDKPIGILQNAPTSGAEAVVAISGVSKVNSDAALALGDTIGTAADGQLATYVNGTDTTKYIVGIVIAASANAGEYATAVINCPGHRGA